MIVPIRNSLSYKTILSSPLLTSKSNQKSTYFNKSTSSSESLTKTNQPLSIQKLFHKDWLSPNEVVKIFNTAQPTSVLSLLNHVSNRKDFKPNEPLYTVIITKLGQAKNFDAIDDMLTMIKTQKSLHLSDGFFLNVLKVYGDVGGLTTRVIETLFDMPSYNCWPSVKTFNYVLNLLVSSRKYDDVGKVYVGASRLCVQTDVCTLNILIKGLCGRGLVEDALQVLDEFPNQNRQPNKQTFSTLMHCMCEKGMVEDAFGLVERMEREGVSPDSVTFNVLISGLQKQGRVEEAMGLLDRMRLKGCEPNKGTYQEVLYGLLRANRFVDAKDFVGVMRLKRMIPSFSSYKLLVLGLCEQGLVGDVDWVLKSMVQVGFAPRMGMWKKVVDKMFPREEDGGNVAFFSKIVEE